MSMVTLTNHVNGSSKRHHFQITESLMAGTGFVECRHIKAEVYNQVEEHNYLADIECDGATTDKGCFDEGSCLIQCLCGASFYRRNLMSRLHNI